jgi:phosphoserine phosphatase
VSGTDATLVFVRHGESTAIVEGRFQGRLDVPLSESGSRQAELVARRLARPHDAPALPIPGGAPLEIVHSPLTRAADTAREIATAAGGPGAFGVEIPLRADDGLMEIEQGMWEGLHADAVTERWGDVLSAWRQSPLQAWAPGGESLPVVRDRVRPSIDGLIERLGDGRTPGAVDRPQVLGGSDPAADQPWAVVVGHDGVFKVALLTLLGMPLEHFWTLPFALCGITIVELVGGRARLRAHNLTEHLAPLEARVQAITEERERAGAL